MRNIKNIAVATVRWFFSVIAVLFSLVGFSESFLSGAAGLLFSFLVSPLSDKLLFKRFNFTLSLGKRLIFLLALFVAFFFSYPTKHSSVPQQVVLTSDAKKQETVADKESTNATNVPIEVTPIYTPSYFVVTRVVDGDTIVVVKDSQEHKVRLIGIDTPETVDPRKDVQCFGKEASQYLKNLIEGKNVTLETDETQGDLDKYSRLLRYVYTEDKTLVNKAIIQNGYGFEYTYNLPYKYQSEFKTAQEYATTNKLGLWADSVCAKSEPSTSITTPTPTIDTPPVIEKPSSAYSCNCSKTCGQMSSCAEAQYQLNVCGCKARDADKDGIACDADCQ